MKPLLKGHKNDYRDAEAIAEAVQRPTMRFVAIKTPEQMDLLSLHRVRSRLPHRNRHHTRHLLNQRFLQALLLDFEAHGREAIEECRKQSPLGYVKVLGHLVPREAKIEHSQSLKSMSDQELDAAIEYVRGMLAARAGEIEGTPELDALPAPNGPSPEAALEATLEPTKPQAEPADDGG